MQAIEFETYAKNGIIKLPDKYNKFNDKKIKVIIMSEEDDITHKEKVEKLISFADEYSVEIDDILPNREERNAR